MALLLVSAALYPLTTSFASGEKSKSENVTVLLFHTESVRRLQVLSQSASFRFCNSCAQQRGPLSLDIEVQGSTIRTSTGKVLRQVEFAGDAEVITQAGHRAQTAGHWTIDAGHDALRVRVEVSRERYVEAVLAAEADPLEPIESLKALAIVARSFAAAAPERHPSGTFCDSTHCQALRLESTRHALRDAVWSTTGETMWFGDRQVPAYFTQHCGGITEDAAAAWGGSTSPWLTSHADAWCARVPSQWHASLAEGDVRRALAIEGFTIATAIEEVVPAGRDRSGRVQQIKLRSSRGVMIIPASALRFAVNRSLGWNQLRSDRYQVRRIGDRLVFEGTGYGHGVGLCQAGAAAMAASGKSYRDILHAYFPGAGVRVQAGDAGWTSSVQRGFTWRTTAPDPTILRAAAQAFAEARSRWAGPVNAPEVTVFPSTQAFRQATGRPGWEAAVTQGQRIATQPAAVLATFAGGPIPLLRHEFLHSFVEAEASPESPFWLREGLVAVLNGENCNVGSQATASQVDAALHAANSQAESQRAHLQACALTKELVLRRGLAAAHLVLQHH